MPTLPRRGVQARAEPAYTAPCRQVDPAAVTQIFLDSLKRYGRWYAAAFLPGRHPGAALTGRRLLFLLAVPLFLLVQLLHWLCLALDELLFPGYRHTPVAAPVFITGIPRSGTTYLHRALATGGGFSVFTTWEVLLAPSVLQRRVVHALAALDRRVGAPGCRLFDALFRRFGKGLDDIHPVSLNAPEEDYLLLLPAGACFFLLLAFPFDPWLRRLPMPEQLPARDRKRLFAFYHSLLQRHLYVAPAGARLLSKNAAFAGWPPCLLARYPDACIIVCARHPDSALASQLKALAPARAAFGTDPDGDATAALFTPLYREWYLSLAGFLGTAPRDRVRVVIQEDMRGNSAAVVAAVQRFVGDSRLSGALAGTRRPVASVGSGSMALSTAAPQPDTALAAYQRLLGSPLRVGIPA